MAIRRISDLTREEKDKYALFAMADYGLLKYPRYSLVKKWFKIQQENGRFSTKAEADEFWQSLPRFKVSNR